MARQPLWPPEPPAAGLWAGVPYRLVEHAAVPGFCLARGWLSPAAVEAAAGFVESVAATGDLGLGCSTRQRRKRLNVCPWVGEGVEGDAQRRRFLFFQPAGGVNPALAELCGLRGIAPNRGACPLSWPTLEGGGHPGSGALAAIEQRLRESVPDLQEAGEVALPCLFVQAMELSQGCGLTHHHDDLQHGGHVICTVVLAGGATVESRAVCGEPEGEPECVAAELFPGDMYVLARGARYTRTHAVRPTSSQPAALPHAPVRGGPPSRRCGPLGAGPGALPGGAGARGGARHAAAPRRPDGSPCCAIGREAPPLWLPALGRRGRRGLPWFAAGPLQAPPAARRLAARRRAARCLAA
ncbi:unnamed protein product, partial [Prorocentrum cordatum]